MSKKLLSFLIIGLFFTAAKCQTPTETKTKKMDGPWIQLTETEFNFGSITEGTQANHVFSFKNTGNKPLIITNVSTPCGCTTPHYTNDPVLPGKKGEITVNYNSSGRGGDFSKILSITTNIPDKTYTITIKGNVVPAATESAH